MFTRYNSDNLIKVSTFKTDAGNEEFFLILHSNENSDFKKAAEGLLARYKKTLKKHNLSDNTLILSRIYLTDIQNQKRNLAQSGLISLLKKGAVSVVQQNPLDSGVISLFTYHVKSKTKNVKKIVSHDSEKWRNSMLLSGNNYKMLWTANFSGSGVLDSRKQTDEILKSINSAIKKDKMSFFKHALRSWVYVKDIDNHYKGMVESRKKFFFKNNLTSKTRYIASTGIEGSFKDVNSLVSADILFMNGLKKEQIIRIEAKDNLPPTIKYGVTFERGLRIRFGDRSHIYISGTASIDKNGKVLYPGDIKKQTERVFENINALLKTQHARMPDMAYIIVYIRDIKAEDAVKTIVGKHVSKKIPVLYVKSSICRPEWLVEIEGMAIVSDSNHYPVFF